MMKNAIHLEYVQTIQLPHHIEGMNFLDHTFVFVVEVVINHEAPLKAACK